MSARNTFLVGFMLLGISVAECQIVFREYSGEELAMTEVPFELEALVVVLFEAGVTVPVWEQQSGLYQVKGVVT